MSWIDGLIFLLGFAVAFVGAFLLRRRTETQNQPEKPAQAKLEREKQTSVNDAQTELDLSLDINLPDAGELSDGVRAAREKLRQYREELAKSDAGNRDSDASGTPKRD